MILYENGLKYTAIFFIILGFQTGITSFYSLAGGLFLGMGTGNLWITFREHREYKKMMKESEELIANTRKAIEGNDALLERLKKEYPDA